jgi:hypothetical protein
MIPSELTKALDGFASAFGTSAIKSPSPVPEPEPNGPPRPRVGR